MRETPRGLAPAGPQRVIEHLTSVSRSTAEIVPVALTTAEGVPVEPVDSSDAGPQLWLSIAAAIDRQLDDLDAVIVLHGTDTLAYSAAATAFLLHGLDAPVVFTCSQRPLDFPGSDAVQNLADALALSLFAAVRERHDEVLVVAGGQVLRGTRVTKVEIDDPVLFASPNQAPVGWVAPRGVVLDAGRERAAGPRRAGTSVERRVALVHFFPGISGVAVERQLTDVRGAVLVTFGAGNVPTDPQVLGALRRAADAGTALLSTSQVARGSVDHHRYAAGAVLADIGVVGGGDMTLEAALTKMAVVLGEHDGVAAARLLASDLRGEMTAASSDPQW